MTLNFTNMNIHVSENMTTSVEYSQQSAAGSAGVSVFSVSANTSIPFLYLGCVCDLEMRKPDSGRTSYFTRIMVTDAWHEVDAVGHYTGSFRAIASDTGFLPKPEFTVPVAQPQLAAVTDNADPEDQVRIQVHFHWQLHDTTAWIRMMAPDAGGTDQVTQNRGYVAIPEVGDQVMVGFQFDHPDRPFVMGGMFHGGRALGGGEKNHIKSITTRSGCTIIFDDTDNQGSITVKDPSGNVWYMDGQGNIDVTAPKNMNFSIGENFNITVGKDMTTTVGDNQSNTIGSNISTNAGNNITVSAGNDIMETATGNRMEMSNNRTEIAEETILRQSNTSETFAGEISITSTKENMTMQSAKTIEWNSGEKSNLF